MYLRIVGAEGEAAIYKGRRVRLASIGELINNNVEIRRGRAMYDADGGEGFTVGLEVLPGTRRSAAEDELEPERTGVPGLVCEGRFLVLGVEGADRGEWDRVQREQHGVIVPQRVRWYGSDG